MSSTDLVIIDPDGDLILRVGEKLELEPVQSGPTSNPDTVLDNELEGKLDSTKAIDFKVCSATLRRASPYFKALLYGGFAESKPEAPTAPWTVRLLEDDPLAMDILLHLLHGFHDKIQSVSSRHLYTMYNILVAVDKYELTRHVSPWPQGWEMKEVDYYLGLLGPNIPPSLHDTVKARALFVAWELGSEHVLYDTVRDIICHSHYDTESGQLFISEGGVPVEEALAGCPIPPEVSRAISEIRLDVLLKVMTGDGSEEDGFLGLLSQPRCCHRKRQRTTHAAAQRAEAEGPCAGTVTRSQSNIATAEACEAGLMEKRGAMMSAMLFGLPWSPRLRAMCSFLRAVQSVSQGYSGSLNKINQVITVYVPEGLAQARDVAVAALEPMEGHGQCALQAVDGWSESLSNRTAFNIRDEIKDSFRKHEIAGLDFQARVKLNWDKHRWIGGFTFSQSSAMASEVALRMGEGQRSVYGPGGRMVGKKRPRED